ncbi:MAG: phosphate ABC transporter permease PstA [Planctomycetota bacterium]|nr:phosphate ABC transporter permease PstA [Planctomycetota bacterium]
MSRGRAADRLLALAVWVSVLAVAAVFFWILGSLLWSGMGRVTWAFLTTAPRDAGRAGGIGPILVSTLLILGVCMAVSLPLGLGAAVLLSEFAEAGSLFGRAVRRSLDVLAGVPSIVFGLFGTALFCQALGLGYSIFAGGLTLACMVLPILIRATEEGFRSAPSEYRRAAAALGMSRASALWHVLLPAAAPGLLVGLVLGMGRALAETAALLFTSGYVDRMPESLLDSARALSIHIYDLSMNVTGGDPNACATAVVLVALLLAVNGLAAWMTGRWLSRRVLPA